MSNESTKTNQITEGVIWKQLLIFFFPIVVGTLFQQLYNTVGICKRVCIPLMLFPLSSVLYLQYSDGP